MIFTREDWTLFRNVGTLGQGAGVSLERLRRLVVKELADNALDASGACTLQALPGGGYAVADEGPGIDGTAEQIAALFSVKRPLASSKLIRLPTRGAMGNGLRVVVGAVLASGGFLVVQTRGRRHTLRPMDDGSTAVEAGEAVEPSPGTRVEIHLGASIPADPRALSWGEAARRWAGAGRWYAGRSSPWWYDSDSFFELCQAAGERPAREVVANLDGCSGSGRSGEVARGFKGRAAAGLSRDEAESLLASARAGAKPVKWVRLGCVGPSLPSSQGPVGYAKRECTLTLEAARGKLAAELPAVVEAWARAVPPGANGNGGGDSLTVLVNRTPVTGDTFFAACADPTYRRMRGCELDDPVKVGRKPVAVTLHISTPFMPVTTNGKAPSLEAFGEVAAELTVKAVGRLRRTAAAALPATKGDSQKEIILDHLAEAIQKTSGGGAYRFSQRQLFYGVRPFVMAATGGEPEYDYFCRVLTDYESAAGPIAGMYRDPRGVLYHPHAGEEIALGTIAVEQYRRPAWTFNKILFSEKEGFFAILKETRWPERHDCALLTSKGFASRAVRDVLDLLGETGEEIQVFCIHDADASGTMIYQSLQDETAARPGRKARIVNLGLEPEEAMEMGLEVEAFKAKGRRPVASYVPAEWGEWLQGQRVELNAMTTPQFLAWLDRKMAEHSKGKVIPPPPVLKEQLAAGVRETLRRTIQAEVLRKGRAEERAAEAFAAMGRTIDGAAGELAAAVRSDLKRSPDHHWPEPVRRFAEKLAGGTNGRGIL